MLRRIRTERNKDIITTIIPKEWEEYFRELLTEQREEFREEDNGPQNIRTSRSPIKITKEEVRKQYTSLKNGRVPGPEDIYGELLKYGSDKLYAHLTELFKNCLNGREVPVEWKVSYMSPIF